MSEFDKAVYRNILKLARDSKFISEDTYKIEIEKLNSGKED